MLYDIIIVTYNSQKWLSNCVGALAETSCDKLDLNLIFVDNNSTDDTVEILNSLKTNYNCFGGFEIIKLNQNCGFGVGCNIGAKSGKAPFLFFLNADTCVFPCVFNELNNAIKGASANIGAFECRQLPIETGHYYNPVTFETSWASGAALVVRRNVFETIDGFDKHLFMYCEDVDLSWRIRAAGYKICYVCGAKVTHFSYEGANTPKLSEYAGSFYGNLILRYKYGTISEIVDGHKMFLGALKRPVHFENVRKVLAKLYLKQFVKLWPFLFWRFKNKKLFLAKTYNFNGGFDADRGQFEICTLKQNPLVSIIIRTFNKPYALREAIKSVESQTYKNIEIIVCEDGNPVAKQMIETEFSHLNINYICSGAQLGRSKNGNLGLASAKGEWCCFLDDDDLFFADHIECLLCAAEKTPKASLILGSAFAAFTNIKSIEPFEYDVKRLAPMVFNRINVFSMCQMCQIPIQTALFKRELFLTYGGLHEGLNANEDWAMWLKFLSHNVRSDAKGADVTRITSLFVQDFDQTLAQKRLQGYAADNKTFFADDSLRFDLSLADIRGFYKDILADVEHVWRLGEMEQFLQETKKRYDD